MFWQREEHRSGVSMTLGATYELDLPKSGLLGSIVLYIRSTAISNAFLSVIKWRLMDYISKIEVIGDGSEVIKSYDGRQAITSAFFDDGRQPASMPRTYATTSQRQWFPIHFGRHFLDELYGLDLSRFNQVTLKITNDGTTSLWNTDMTIDVLCYWLREAGGAFAGYFREEEWKTWNPVANAWEYNDLPIALPIRRILLRCRPFWGSADAKASSSMHRSADDIEFTFRSGQTRVYRGSLENLGHMTAMDLDLMVETRGSIDRTAAYGFETHVGYCMQNMGYGGADAGGITTALANMSKDVQNSAQESAYRPANGPLAYVVRGHGYGHCVPLWIARKPALEDLLLPDAMKEVALNVHCQSGTTVSGTGTAAESAIILSRLVT